MMICFRRQPAGVWYRRGTYTLKHAHPYLCLAKNGINQSFQPLSSDSSAVSTPMRRDYREKLQSSQTDVASAVIFQDQFFERFEQDTESSSKTDVFFAPVLSSFSTKDETLSNND